MLPPSLLMLSSGRAPVAGPTAAVERGLNTNAPSKLARLYSSRGQLGWSLTARVERPQFYRGGFHERTGPPSCPLTFPSSPAAHQTHARTLCTECNRTRQRTHQIESPCRRNPGTSRGGLADHPRSRIAFHGDNRLAFRRSATRCQRRPRPARRDNDG